MKLFKNGVGRPSNEIKKKRKIFIASMILLCVTLVSCVILIFTKHSIDDIKAATATPKYTKDNTKLDVKFNNMYCNTFGDACKDKKINMEIAGKGGYAKYASVVTCTNKSDCTRSDAWDAASSKNRTNRFAINKIYNTINLSESTKTIKERTFYARVTTYISNSASNWAQIYVYEIKPTQFTKDGKNSWFVNSSLVYSKINSKIIKASSKDLWLNCNGSTSLGTEASCTVSLSTNSASAINGAKVTAVDSSIATIKNVNNNKYSIVFNEKLFTKYKNQIKNDNNGNKYIETKLTASKAGYKADTYTLRVYQLKYLFFDCDDSKELSESVTCVVNSNGKPIPRDVKLTVADSSIAAIKKVDDIRYEVKFNEKLFTKYKNQIKTESNEEYINAKISVNDTEYTKNSKIVKIYRKKESTKNLVLNCPTSAKLGQTFKCTANQSGVTIILGGSNSLASGIKSSFKTTSNNKTKDIKYTSALFKNYKTIIKKDEKGKEYINAKIVAKKSGFNNITKYVRIYK